MRTIWAALLAAVLLFPQAAPAADEPAPFGANLFQGNFTQTRGNDAREAGPGDRLVLRLWGSRSFDGVLPVNEAGEIELPEVGPIPVAGLAQNQLAEAIKSKLSALGDAEVQIYVALLDSRPVSLFVTGFVPKPGRYDGQPTDPILAFLDRAGGIDPRRGSFRNIRLLRAGKELARFDLYPFVLRGELPHVRLRDGDTLVVGERGPLVTATGEVRNTARFEFLPGQTTGAALAALADPLPQASHARLSGTRGGAPYNLYLSLGEFNALRLAAGDKVQFLADTPGDTIMVEVQGAIRGVSLFPLKRNARLKDVQNYISVDRDRANLKALYIKRQSVAVRQKRAIEEALRRLEESSATATSITAEGAQIRSHEAEMIAKFVEKAKSVQPEGIVVVGAGGKLADIALEDGDIIVVPEKSDVVLVSGEVMVPQAIVWNKDRSLKEYVRAAGGYTNRADSGNILLVRQSGELFRASDADIEPGDQILVLPEVDSKNMQVVKDMSQILYQIAVSAKVAIGF